jgi:hypothetical protein
VRVPELVLADGVLSDQALMSSSMSETVILDGSNVRGTVIVSDLRWEVDSGLWDAVGATGEGRVRGEGGSERSSEARRVTCGGRVMLCGNVGSSCGFGTEVCGTEGKGLLWVDGWSVPELTPRGIGKSESGRARPFEESREEGRETSWLNSREYHNASSSSSSSSPFDSFCPASSPERGENGPRVNSKVSSECASEAERDVDLIMRGCLEMRGDGMAAFLEGTRRPGDSSSEAPGVNGISVLEQADMLVREGVGEHDRAGDRRRRSRRRGGVQGAAGISLTGEAGSDGATSMTISNELRRTDRCINLVDGDDDGDDDDDGGGRGAARGTVLRKSSVRENAPNSFLP